MEEESKEYVDKIEVVDEKSITLLIQKITLRMKLRLKSRLKTIKGQKLVEDFTEYLLLKALPVHSVRSVQRLE